LILLFLFSKLIAIDLKLGNSVSFGRIAMVILAVLGTIPVFLNAEILSAAATWNYGNWFNTCFLFWKVKVPKNKFYLSVTEKWF
jgi:drug/metabolite transporter superfamily protein YnfA